MKEQLLKFYLPGLMMTIGLLLANLTGFSQTVITNPASPWVVPAGVTSIKVEVWGGGGAGGGCNSALGASYGSGGGGGAYNQTTLTVAAGQSYTSAIGAGGLGASDANGGNGTASSVTGPGGAVTANFGLGGGRRAGTVGAGGAAGTFAGGAGGLATSNGAGGGAGAGNAGAGGNGSNTAGGTGGAGNPNIAPNTGGAGAAAKTDQGSGNTGTAPGGGGSGGKQTGFFGGAKAGGNGAAGQVVITYCTTYNVSGLTAQSPVCAGSGTSVITINSSSLPTGNYIVTYERDNPAATGLTATMNVSTAGTGSFIATGLTVAGNPIVKVTSIASATSAFCTTAINTNNTVTVTVDPVATVNAGADQVICASSPTITLAGTIGGSAGSATWTGGGVFIPNNTSLNAFYTPSAAEIAAGTVTLTLTTNDPAGACAAASDQMTVTIKVSPASLVISPAAATICIGNSTNLAAASVSTSTSTLSTENFNTAGSYIYTTAGSNSGGGTAFSQQVSPYNFGLTTVTNNDASRFMIATAWSFTTASTTSTMTSPVINTTAYSNLTLSFRHSYTKGLEAGVSVQVSTDAGNTVWSNISTSGAIIGTNTFTSTQGANNNFVNASINLTPFINSPNLRIRFNFVSNVIVATSWWAIDNVAVNGAVIPLVYWSANTAAGINGLPAGAGTPSLANRNISVNPTQTTSYSFTAKDPVTNCETSSGTAVVTVNLNGSIALSSATGTDLQQVCNNTAITPVSYQLGGSATGAGVTGLPAGINGLFNAGVFTISGSSVAAGTYNYTVTTTGPCTQATANGSITISAPITATFTTTNVSACGGSADATINVTPTTGTAPYTFSWTGMTGVGAHTPFTAGNVSGLTGLDIGYYDVTFTDANGCSGTITGIHIQYAFSAFVTNNGSISSGCANTGSIILYANAGVQPYTYSLDGIIYQSNNTFLNLAAGSYTAYVKDGGGCVATKSIFVAAAPPVVVNPFVRPASSCSNDGAIEIYRTGGIPPYQYSLDGISYQSGNTFLNLAAGPYTAYVKDSKGCIGVTQVTVTQGASLGLTVSKTLVSTCQNDGSLQATPTGGTASYTYSLDDVTYQAGNSFAGLAAGNYTVWVKDSKGCKGFRNVTLNLNLIGVTYSVTAAGSCASANGMIQLFRTGGVGPYTYSIDGNAYQGSNTFTNLAPGTYDGFVKDSKTCIGATFNIVVGPENCGGGITTTTRGLGQTPVQVDANSVLKVSAYPNPSTASFKLILDGGSNEKVVITVSDLAGRTIYQSQGSMNKQYNFGSNFIPGMYILTVIQGNDKQTIKLVKE